MVSLATTRFDDGSGDLPGFWGPVTSTIDWCEHNYVVTYYVAEFWNTVSSFLMSVGGLIGIYWSIKCGHPTKLSVFAAGIALVGFGSAAFHGTLLFRTQLMDELPMIYAMLMWWRVWFDCLQQLKQRGLAYAAEKLSPRSIPVDIHDPEAWAKSIYWLKPVAGAMKWIRMHSEAVARNQAGVMSFVVDMLLGTKTRFFITYAITGTVAHSVYGFTTAFQTHFMLMVGVSILTVLEFRKHFQLAPGVLALITRWCNYYVIFSALASISWIIDNTFCPYLHKLPVYPQNHAIWHVFVGFSTYSGFVVTVIAHQITSTATPVSVGEMAEWREKRKEDNLTVWQFTAPLPRVENLYLKFKNGLYCAAAPRKRQAGESDATAKGNRKSDVDDDLSKDTCSLVIPYCWVEGPTPLQE